MTKTIKTYSELILLPTFKERFDYLFVGGRIGVATFGAERYLNQVLYHSAEWKELRSVIILRDNACDLGIDDREILRSEWVRIHHINPITPDDVRDRSPKLFDPENLITCSSQTHQAIHYTGWVGTIQEPVTRKPNDTCPWR